MWLSLKFSHFLIIVWGLSVFLDMGFLLFGDFRIQNLKNAITTKNLKLLLPVHHNVVRNLSILTRSFLCITYRIPGEWAGVASHITQHGETLSDVIWCTHYSWRVSSNEWALHPVLWDEERAQKSLRPTRTRLAWMRTNHVWCMWCYHAFKFQLTECKRNNFFFYNSEDNIIGISIIRISIMSINIISISISSIISISIIRIILLANWQ